MFASIAYARVSGDEDPRRWRKFGCNRYHELAHFGPKICVSRFFENL